MRNMFGQVVFRTGVITLFIVFTVFSYGLSVFGFIAPRTMADFCTTLGSHNAAGMYYERIYNGSKTNSNLYAVVDRYISARNYQKIDKYGSKLVQPEYNEFLQGINASEELRADNKEEYLLLCNEGNRVKFMYAYALLKQKKYTSASDIYLEDWLKDPIDLAQPLHTLYAFLATGRADQQIINATKEYYSTFVSEYETERVNLGNQKIMALDFIIVFGGYFLGTENSAINETQWLSYRTEYRDTNFIKA